MEILYLTIKKYTEKLNEYKTKLIIERSKKDRTKVC